MSAGSSVGDDRARLTSSIGLRDDSVVIVVVWEDDRNAPSMAIDIYGDLVNVLSGSVYGGLYPDTGWPLSGVEVALFCSDTPGVWGTYREGTKTDSSGAYALATHADCSYYNIGQNVPEG